MKKLLSIILTAAISAASAISAFAYDKTNITVHNTEKHGLYITVGGTKIYCDKTELPFIDENDRTQIPVRAVSNALGKKVDWNDTDKTVTISDYNDDKTLLFLLLIPNQCLKIITQSIWIQNLKYSTIIHMCRLSFWVKLLNVRWNIQPQTDFQI